MSILFMIPARSGSKGIKNKNIREILGKPLFYYAMKAVQEVMSDDDMLFFNTDSQLYADKAVKFGASVPFLRPSELSGDSSPVTAAMEHTFQYFRQKNISFDYFALVQPTSPLIIAQDVQKAVEIVKKKSVKSVISVTPAEFPPLWCNTIADENQDMKDFISPEISCLHRQQLPVYYRLAGCLRIAEWDALEANGFSFSMADSRPCIIPNERAVDIDTILDMQFAEFLLHRRFKSDCEINFYEK